MYPSPLYYYIVLYYYSVIRLLFILPSHGGQKAEWTFMCVGLLHKRVVVSECGRMEELIGSIVAEVDVPTSKRVLAALDVIGTVGTAKLHVPKNKPVICFLSCWTDF